MAGKPNKFSLSKNTNKRPDKQDADYTGSLMLDDGTEFWMNAWINRTDRDGKELPKDEWYFSGSIRQKETKQQGRSSSNRSAAPSRGRDDVF